MAERPPSILRPLDKLGAQDEVGAEMRWDTGCGGPARIGPWRLVSDEPSAGQPVDPGAYVALESVTVTFKPDLRHGALEMMQIDYDATGQVPASFPVALAHLGVFAPLLETDGHRLRIVHDPLQGQIIVLVEPRERDDHVLEVGPIPPLPVPGHACPPAKPRRGTVSPRDRGGNPRPSAILRQAQDEVGARPPRPSSQRRFSAHAPHGELVEPRTTSPHRRALELAATVSTIAAAGNGVSFSAIFAAGFSAAEILEHHFEAAVLVATFSPQPETTGVS